jgi:hypothetical protein
MTPECVRVLSFCCFPGSFGVQQSQFVETLLTEIAYLWREMRDGVITMHSKSYCNQGSGTAGASGEIRRW